MSQPGFTYKQVQLVRVKLNLQIPEGCSQGALLEYVKQSLLLHSNTLHYSEVYFHGLANQLWSFDVKVATKLDIFSPH